MKVSDFAGDKSEKCKTKKCYEKQGCTNNELSKAICDPEPMCEKYSLFSLTHRQCLQRKG